MTAKDFSRYVRGNNLYEKNTSLAAFSDGSIFINGDLDALEKEAKKSGVEIFILKDNRKKKKDIEKNVDNGTSINNIQ